MQGGFPGGINFHPLDDAKRAGEFNSSAIAQGPDFINFHRPETTLPASEVERLNFRADIFRKSIEHAPMCNAYRIHPKRDPRGIEVSISEEIQRLPSTLVRRTARGVVVTLDGADFRPASMRWGFHRAFSDAINNARSDKPASAKPKKPKDLKSRLSGGAQRFGKGCQITATTYFAQETKKRIKEPCVNRVIVFYWFRHRETGVRNSRTITVLTITKQQLLKDRAVLVKQLASIDAMLKAMFDWESDVGPLSVENRVSSTPARSTLQDVGQPEMFGGDQKNGVDDDSGNSIAYTTEAIEWAKGCSGRVKVKDFNEWLKAKYPPHMINRNSINQPFRKLVKDGILILVRQGVGKIPSIFEVNPNPPT